MKKILIIIFLGLLVYFPILFNGFVWDDEATFQKASSILGNVYFRPIISAIESVIYNIFGPRPFFFHLFQLTFHIIVAILIFYLFRRFFKETISLILAIIFLVHPVNVEAVSFASAMQEVVFTLTGIIGLYLFVNTEERMDSRRSLPSTPIGGGDDKKKSGNDVYLKVFFGTLFLLIALLMKETAIVFFVLVFGYLLLFKRKQTNVLVNYSIFAVISLTTYLFVRILNGNLYVQGQGLFPIMRVSLTPRLINIPMIILFYLTKFFYPINLGIAQNWVVRTVDLRSFWLPIIIVTGLFLLGILLSFPPPFGDRLRRESRLNKPFLFFFLWFLIGLLPHLQIVPLNMTVAERWLYFPMIGLLGMIGAVIKISNIKYQKSKILLSFAIVIITIFSIRSFVRPLDWRNGLALFGHDIRKDSSFDLQNNFGVELFRVGRYDEAKKYFEISTKLAPYWWVNWNNLGASYEREKNYQKATEYYQKAIGNGQYYLAYENMAKILVLHGNDPKKAVEFLKKSLELFPKDEILQQLQVYYQQKISHSQP